MDIEVARSTFTPDANNVRHLHPARLAPRTLDDVLVKLRRDEANELPDVVTGLNTLRMTENGTISVPGAGSLVLNDWSRSQLASLVGLRWDRWFVNASPGEQAEEINRRFARAGTSDVKIRASRVFDTEADADGVLRAIVTPSYSPISDVTVASTLREALTGIDDRMRIVRSTSTDMTTGYIVRVGDTFKPGGPGAVGDVWGCLAIRNSGVGFAKLVITSYLMRLACLNGMVLPLGDAVIVAARHRAISMDLIREKIVAGLAGIGERLHRGARVLAQSEDHRVADVEAEVRQLLKDDALPVRLLPPVMAAYAREPSATRFGVSQAITLAAQDRSPEERFELEQLAGRYLARAA